jgi:hypothetical protein
VARAASHTVAWYSEVLARQTPRVLSKSFAFDTFDGLHASANELLKRLHCLVFQASVAHDGLEWFSAHRRLGFAVARAVRRQLASRLPCGALREGVHAVAGFSQASSGVCTSAIVRKRFELLVTDIQPIVFPFWLGWVAVFANDSNVASRSHGDVGGVPRLCLARTIIPVLIA